MIKKIFLTLILVLSSSLSCNSMVFDIMTIEMPEEAKLRTLFSNYDLNHFVDKTNIIDNLTGRKTFLEIKTAIKREIKSYHEILGEYTDLVIIVNIKKALYNIINEIIENKPKNKAAFANFIEKTNQIECEKIRHQMWPNMPNSQI